MKNYLLIGLSALLLAFVSPLPDIPGKPEDISPLLVGETIPDVTLVTMAGQPVNLKAEVAKKPTLLVFYRGGWCPFCTKQLAELRTLQPDLNRMGYQMIAISTDAPEGLKATYDKNELTYTLLSDADVAVGRAFGLAFKAPAGYSEMLAKSSNGKNVDKLLPVPAVFVLDTKGVIKYEHINPNFKERVSGKVLKAVAEALQ
jgi:peroxiredoxin